METNKTSAEIMAETSAEIVAEIPAEIGRETAEKTAEIAAEKVKYLWHTRDLRAEGKESAEFYKQGDNQSIVSVSLNGRTIEVRCDGQLRVVRDCLAWIEYSTGLASVGITDEKSLEEASGILRNPWFDAYEEIDGVDEHLDMVNSTLSDAIGDAIKGLMEGRA